MENLAFLSSEEVEEILNAGELKSAVRTAEHRAHQRWPYPTTQWMAPYGPWGFPAKGMFQPVRCYDISRGGISFFLPRPPNFQFAVVTVGTPSELTYLLVRVVHHSKHDAAAGQQYLVGCLFLRRVTVTA